MGKSKIAVALFGALLIAASGVGADIARAEHEDFRFKRPYNPQTSIAVTGYPYTAHHNCSGGSCLDAWDIVIADSWVKNSAEGAAATVVSHIDPNTCDPAGGHGNYVEVAADTPSGTIRTMYGHLASTNISAGSTVRQGDAIGIQGHTGNTWGNTPPPCGTHLHFEFRPARPAVINSQSVINNVTVPGQSTNSVIGAMTLPGAAIRSKYGSLGWPFGSWSTVGWTHDTTGSQQGCASGSFCRLYVHYYPNPQSGHWGSEQTFRRHPTINGGNSRIQAHRWETDPTAY